MSRPTIAELKDILSKPEGTYKIEIAPDGSVKATDTTLSKVEWPDPSPEMIDTPEFNAVWDCIKSWDINVPGAYGGYCGATGNHVRAILDALKKVSK